MDSIFDSRFAGQLAPLRYHVNWPDNTDAAYLYNPTQINARRAYYVFNYVPTVRFEGQFLKDPSDFATEDQWYSYFRNTLDSLAAIPSPLRIDLEHVQSPESVYVKVDIVAESDVSGDLRFFLAVNEQWLRQAPFGKHRYVFRNMIPGITGEPISIASAGDSVHLEYTYAMDDSAFHPTRMINTVWVQNYTTGEVLQANTGMVPQILVDVPAGQAPLRVVLDQNVPNPFNPTTKIRYHLDREGMVRLTVYGPSGRFVTDLVSDYMTQGAHEANWNGKDRSGRDVGSGVYYYRLEAEKMSLTKKMILIR